MDRLARNLDDLHHLVRLLTGKGLRVEFIKEALTFAGEDSAMALHGGEYRAAHGRGTRAGFSEPKSVGKRKGHLPGLRVGPRALESGRAGWARLLFVNCDGGCSRISTGVLRSRDFTDSGITVD